jgi:hypothetical protein
MKITAKLILTISLSTLFFVQAIGAAPTGVKLRALGCEINIPSGYVLSPNNQGNIHASYVGKNHLSNPHFQYYPKDSMDDHVSNESNYFTVLSEEKSGDLRFLKVKFDRKPKPDVTWDVITSNAAFFAAWGVPDSKFLKQFRECAQD